MLKKKLEFSLSGGLLGYIAVTALMVALSLAIVIAIRTVLGVRSRMVIGS
jgi:hypothetical protein